MHRAMALDDHRIRFTDPRIQQVRDLHAISKAVRTKRSKAMTLSDKEFAEATGMAQKAGDDGNDANRLAEFYASVDH